MSVMAEKSVFPILKSKLQNNHFHSFNTSSTTEKKKKDPLWTLTLSCTQLKYIIPAWVAQLVEHQTYNLGI